MKKELFRSQCCADANVNGVMDGDDGLERWVERYLPHVDTHYRPTHGAFHDVLVGETTVARILRGRKTHDRSSREVAIFRALPALIAGVQVPQLRSELVEANSRAGYLVTCLPGVTRQHVAWDEVRGVLEELLHQLHAVSVTPSLTSGLPEPRAWCGGGELSGIISSELAPMLGGASPVAIELTEKLARIPCEMRVLVHGDFGPHNLLWKGAQISALLDWDHATIGDPAIDLAPLIGYFGAGDVGEIVDDEMLNRAMLHRATLSLQVAAAAHLAGLQQLRDHACGNFLNRLQAKTLYDPQGRQPNFYF